MTIQRSNVVISRYKDEKKRVQVAVDLREQFADVNNLHKAIEVAKTKE